MGQQQLLLIILGVIVVGIAVAVGINFYGANSVSSNRDAVIADLTTLASNAHDYYRKPASLGGGNGSFAGWTVPSSLSQTGNMSLAVVATVAAQRISLLGTGKDIGTDGVTTVTVTMIISPNSATSTTINN